MRSKQEGTLPAVLFEIPLLRLKPSKYWPSNTVACVELRKKGRRELKIGGQKGQQKCGNDNNHELGGGGGTPSFSRMQQFGCLMIQEKTDFCNLSTVFLSV